MVWGNRLEIERNLSVFFYIEPIIEKILLFLHRFKELSVDKGLRHRRVDITGTNYHPLDNEFQIREAMRDTCDLINGKDNIFEKALLRTEQYLCFQTNLHRPVRVCSKGVFLTLLIDKELRFYNCLTNPPLEGCKWGIFMSVQKGCAFQLYFCIRKRNQCIT